jgi:predicted dehydrogenase
MAATSSSNDEQDGSTLRYAVVGTGMMGLEHLHALAALPNTQVVALCDPHESSLSKARSAVTASSPIAIHRSVDDLVAAGGFDVAVVASPNHTHRRVLEPLLRHGSHLLIEKPLCITTAECREVIQLEEVTRASAVSNRVVWVGLEYRYMAPTMRLLAHARSGALGRLRMLGIREHRFPFLVKVGDWNRFSANTGGTLVEKCCHFFDLMRLLLQSEPTRVYASGAQDVNHLNERYDGRIPDILDNALVIVDFADGSRASLDLCMFAEATRNEQEISLVGDAGKAEALVTEGVVRVGLRKNGWFQCDEEVVPSGDVPVDVLRHGSHHGSSWREHVAMQAAIRNGTTPEVTLHDGLLSVAMGEAAHRSISTGRPVMMHEILG